MEHMIFVRDFAQADYKALEKMLITYFSDDLGVTASEEKIIDQVVNVIYKHWVAGNCLIAIVTQNDTPIGFAQYQIDTPQSDWCRKEGWGFLREVYIDKSCRKQGLGMQLARYCEDKLYQQGVTNLYLTADDAIAFWEKLGYVQIEEKGNHDTIVLVK